MGTNKDALLRDICHQENIARAIKHGPSQFASINKRIWPILHEYRHVQSGPRAIKPVTSSEPEAFILVRYNPIVIRSERAHGGRNRVWFWRRGQPGRIGIYARPFFSI